MKAHGKLGVTCTAVGLALLFASIAAAAQTETHSITINDAGADFIAGASGAFSLPQFDDNGGTRALQQMTLQITAHFFGGSNSLDSESPFAGLATVMIGSNLTVDAPLSLSIVATQPSQIAENLPVTADDEAGFADFIDNGYGDDCVAIAGVDFVDTRSGMLSNPPADLGEYIGDGEVLVTFHSAVNSMASATVAPTWAYVEAPRFYFDVEIIYTYAPDIPEPATLALLGIGGTLLLARYKRK